MAIRRAGTQIERETTKGYAGIASTQRYPIIIGTAPATRTVEDEAVRATLDGLDSAANTILSIVRIGTARGVASYVEGQDFQLSNGQIDWASLPGNAPTKPSVGAAAAGAGNSGTISITGQTCSDDPDSDVYTVTFTGATAFSVTNRAGEAQGTGTVAVDFTTSDGQLTLPASGWSGTAVAGDTLQIPVSAGQTYYVTYTHTRPASDYQTIHEVRDLSEIEPIVGEASLTNLLPLALRLVLAQGARLCRFIISQGDTNADIVEALSLAEQQSDLTDICIICGSATEDQRHASLRAHVIAQSSKDVAHYRMGYLGFAANTAMGSKSDLTSVIGKMNALAHGRLVGVANTWATENLTGLGLTVDGSLIACALMGARAAQTNPAQPLLRHQLVGFSDVEDVTAYDLDLIEVGGCILQNRGGVITVREMSTLAGVGAAPEEQEVAVYTADDWLAKYIAEQVDVFVGEGIDDPDLFPEMVKGKIIQCLLKAMDDKYIARTAITNNTVQAKISSLEPREIKFTYQYYNVWVCKWLTGSYRHLRVSEL